MNAAAMAWAWHAAASVGGAALVAWCAVVLHRRLGLSHAAHRYWLGAWALAALPAPLAVGLDALLPAALPTALPVLMPFDEWSAALTVSVAEVPAAATLLPSPGMLLLIVYAGGVACGALRWALAVRALRRVLRAARPFDPGALPTPLRDACLRLDGQGIRIATTAQPVSPFAVCVPVPAIVLPRALLARLDTDQLLLVLRHEAAHLARRDPQCAALLRAIGLLLWFNPALPALARRVQLAAELACDAAALAAEKNMRRAYAEAYLATLRMSMAQALPCPATAFSPHDPGSHRMRIQHIVHGDPNARNRPLLAAALAFGALATGGGLTAVHASTAGMPAPTPESAAPAFAGPIVDGRISSRYGTVRERISATPHKGVDLTAARGTPVHAPAAGTVVVATAQYEPAPNYGTVVVLDHGDGWQTVYAHLDSLGVAVGDAVAHGDAIGTLGTTGQATGPHVHVEVLRDGERVDPAEVIAAPLVD